MEEAKKDKDKQPEKMEEAGLLAGKDKEKKEEQELVSKGDLSVHVQKISERPARYPESLSSAKSDLQAKPSVYDH